MKAGVPFKQLPKVVAKELCDNALDAAGNVRFGLLKVDGDEVSFFVEDSGEGLDGTDEQIAKLFW
ncbi:MAG: hypothetical protein ACJ8C4_09615 [Gemmataceae bacterium]